MTKILQFIEELSPFLQSLLGSAFFASILLLGRVVTKGLGRAGRMSFKVISHDLMMKHILHRKYINSENIFSQVWSNFFAIRQALHWFIMAITVLVFFLGVDALIRNDWLVFVGLYLTLNGLMEAGSWLKDTSDEKHIRHLDPEVRDELLNKYKVNNEQKEVLDVANKVLNSQASPAGTPKDGAH